MHVYLRIDYYRNMKKITKLFILSPLAFSLAGCGETSSSSSSTPKDPEPCDVIVISGQSNAVGISHSSCITRSIGASKYQEYLRGYDGIQIAFDNWDKLYQYDPPQFYSQHSSKDDTFMKVMLGQGNGDATFGPEIGIAEKMHEKYSGKLFLIKFACGASNLRDDWALRESPMYGRFISYVKLQMENLKKMGYIPTIKAFCWMQGEGDAYDGLSNVYYENIKGFVTNVRADLKELSGNVDMPFIDAGINNVKDENDQYRWPNWEEVNNAKKQFAAESDNNFYIDTIAAGLHSNQEPFAEPDLAHYDTESQVLLGRMFAENFEPFLMK